MNSNDFTPTEQELIARLQNAPQRRLSARTAQAIQEKMLAEVAQPHPPTLSARSAGMTIRHMRFAVGFAAVFVMVVAGVLLTRELTQQDPSLVSPLTTEVAAQVTQPPSVVTIPLEITELTQALSSTPSITQTPTPADTSTPAHTPAPTQTQIASVVIIEGLVENIDENVMTIHGIEITIPADHPILEVIDVGDMLRVEGTRITNDTLIAEVIDNLLDTAVTDATVGMAGPIDAIEDNIITINGIELVIDPQDLTGQSLEVGDFLSVEGNFELRDTGYLLVVLHVEVITEAGMSISPSCYYEETGMGAMGMEGMAMGRWRCDGMGAMGMGAMGMEAMGMGMGMGN